MMPTWEKCDRKQKWLFVNWHPGMLGHEIAGNQIAYFHMAVMEIALEQLLGHNASLDSLDVRATLMVAAVQPLPENIHCSDFFCKRDFPPTCAYSFQPRFGARGIEDITLHRETTRWRLGEALGYNVAQVTNCKTRPKEKMTCPSCRCNGASRTCSLDDARYGMQGSVASGPLVLEFKDMFHCKIWIGEVHHASKTRLQANWMFDMGFKVNGEACVAPHCTILVQSHQDAYILQVDARALLGSRCRREPLQVEFEVRPSGPMKHKEYCECMCGTGCKNRARGNHLGDATGGGWRSYKGICPKTGCNTTARYKHEMELVTTIGWAIAF